MLNFICIRLPLARGALDRRTCLPAVCHTDFKSLWVTTASTWAPRRSHHRPVWAAAAAGSVGHRLWGWQALAHPQTVLPYVRKWPPLMMTPLCTRHRATKMSAH